MELLRKHAVRIGLGVLLLLILAGHAARFYEFRFIQQLDAIIYDYRLRLTMPQTIDERIVIVDIDEKSLAAEGRWPWSRDRLAQMLDRLFDTYGVAAVGFDVVFAERDESSGLRVLDQLAAKQFRDDQGFQATLKELRPQLEFDRQFAARIKGRPVVLGYYFANPDAGQKAPAAGVLPEPVLPAGTFKGRAIEFVAYQGFGANLPELQQASAGAGHFNPLTDFDGVHRRVPMLAEFNGNYYESLSLALVRVLIGNPRVEPGYATGPWVSKDYSGLEWLDLATPRGALRIPVDNNVSALVPYRGRQGSFRYVSAVDVLKGEAPAAQFKGRIVLVGTTAPGLLDLRSSPVAAVYPGVEIHANLIAGILDQNLKHKPAYMLAAEVVLLIVTGLVLALLMPLLSPLRALIATAIALLALLAVNFSVWQFGNLVLPLGSALLLVAGLFALNMSYGYFVESRSKRQITGLFGRYVSPQLVDEMSRNPEHISMEGESREMSVLFSDVRGFTTISEGMDPKELSKLMNEFLTPLTQLVYDHRGTVDKYMGDCIMAFWGAPLPDPDHARNAVIAGMAMQRRLAELQPSFRERGWPEIHIGVGVNSGNMRVGNMGSQMRVAYTVMGDAVNLASRLEGITKQYGVGMVVGEGTKQRVPDFVFRELDHVRVKGKDKPVAIFEPMGSSGSVDKAVQEELKLFHQALKCYRVQDWDKAEMHLYNLMRMAPETKLYEIYSRRIQYFRSNPPGPDWDGVFTFETK